MKQKTGVGKGAISSFAWTDHGSNNPKKNANFWSEKCLRINFRRGEVEVKFLWSLGEATG